MRWKGWIAAGSILLAAAAQASAGSGTVVLLHTNDLHAHFTPEAASWRSDNAPVGGFEAIEATILRERRASPNTLWLDAGDFMTGTPLADIEYRGVPGGAIVEFYNIAGLEGMTIGNHEFDVSPEDQRRLLDMARFPVFGANLFDAEGKPFTGESYRVYPVGDVRVGVIGITTEELGGLLGDPGYAGIRIESGVETLRRIVPEIDPVTDLIVVLSHEGIETDRVIAREVPGIDVIIGGHSHTRLDEGERVGDVWILQAGCNGRYVGRAELEVRDDAVASADCRLITTLAGEAEGTAPVRALVEAYEKRIIEEFGVVIAQASAHMERSYYGESELGDWLADRMREIAGADVALINSGGIRKDLEAGPITKLDIREMLPFQNYMLRFECTGADLLAFALHNARAEAEQSHGIVQISGIEYSYATDEKGTTLHRVTVGGEPVDLGRIYSVASVDYLAVSQPEKYLGFLPGETHPFPGTLTTQVTAAVEKLGRIDPPREDRIRRVAIDTFVRPEDERRR
ncbi:MAG: bifunctional metallophosphatase/5'-nucleotidase [Candidatus Eisenbacteria bacterium]|nr:bifunctional metallophosphatase/5'-nucleotidase [Candidatus Eisenbacteria bacterium]